MTTPNKLLIIRPSCLGDLVQMTPAVEMLRDQRPDVQLSLLTEPEGYTLFDGDPRFERVWLFDRHAWLGEGKTSFHRRVAALTSELRAEGYRWVANLHHGRRAALLTALLEPAMTLGLCARPGGGYRDRTPTEQDLLDSFTTLNAPGTVVRSASTVARETGNRALLYQRIFEVLGCRIDRCYSCSLRLPSGAPDFGLPSSYLVLAPGNSWENGRWPVEHWRETVRAFPGKKFVLVGAAYDGALNARIAEGLPGGQVVDLSGRTTLGDYLHVVAGGECVIANDSSAAHIAAAFDRPSHVLYGPTSPELCGPWSRRSVAHRAVDACDVAPCGEMTCVKEDVRCMSSIQPANVIAALRETLSGRLENTA